MGEGLFILARVVPHESVLLGAALALAGGTLVAIARPPAVERLPRVPLAIAGAAVAFVVVAYNLATRASWVAPKVALVAFGLALAASAPFARDRRVATSVAWSLPLVGAPLLVWAAQALARASLAGMTPMEVFIERGLLAPMSFTLAILGMDPSVSGQIITFATPRGPMSLEVGVACSGLQAMALFAGVLGVLLVSERPGWRRALAWSAIGLGGVYVVNVIRLVALSIVGARWGTSALEDVHAQAGWIFFVAWSGLFAWIVTRRAPRRPRRQREATA